MATFSLYRQAYLAAFSGGINWSSDQITATLHTTSYVPSPDTDAHVSDLSGEVATGGGYTQGGQLLPGRGAAYLPAGAWPDAWQPVTPYQPGQVVRPALTPGMIYRCYAAGTSGSIAPSWPLASGASVADGSTAWSAVGAGAAVLTAGSLQWPGFTASFRYVVISDRSAAQATAQPLIALMDMGGPVSGSGGSLVVVFDSGSGSNIVIPLWAS